VFAPRSSEGDVENCQEFTDSLALGIAMTEDFIGVLGALVVKRTAGEQGFFGVAWLPTRPDSFARSVGRTT
jgi:hypothetical protein